MRAVTSIRQADKNDIPVIRAMALAIWPPTYSPILPSGQVDYMLDLIYSPGSLLEQMNSGIQFLMAEEDNKALGFAAYGEDDDGAIKIHKLYVLTNTQGQGIGRNLVYTITGKATDLNARVLRLNVNRNNKKAKEFYERLGFIIIKEEDIPIGSGFYMNDYVLEKNILT